jgi:hypothetical protein
MDVTVNEKHSSLLQHEIALVVNSFEYQTQVTTARVNENGIWRRGICSQQNFIECHFILNGKVSSTNKPLSGQ